MTAGLEGMMLINLTFPGFTLNLLWSIPVGLSFYVVLLVMRFALRDVTLWVRRGGGMNKEALGLLYLPMLLIALYILIDITVAIYDPVVLHQAAGVFALLLIRLAILRLGGPKRN